MQPGEAEGAAVTGEAIAKLLACSAGDGGTGDGGNGSATSTTKVDENQQAKNGDAWKERYMAANNTARASIPPPLRKCLT